MTYNTIETSAYQGTPVELYEFKFNSLTWYYNSGDSDVFVGVVEYKALSLLRPAFKASNSSAANNIEVSVPRGTGIAEIYRTNPPATPCTLTVKRFHREESGVPEVVTMWSGRVMNASFKMAEVTFSCESILAAKNRSGLRRSFQTQCPHVLFGDHCKADKSTHTIYSIVQIITDVITIGVSGIDGKPDNYYSGGVIEWTDPDTTAVERRMIKSSSGSNVVLSFSAPTMVIGMNVKVVPGCARTTVHCGTKFNNLLNYGGFPFTPSESPFGGKKIY